VALVEENVPFGAHGEQALESHSPRVQGRGGATTALAIPQLQIQSV